MNIVYRGNTCGPADHACKICFETVNIKTGLQCEGACKTWVHFKCLNYPPGKIADIKKGYIKICCPCPDCNSADVKELIINRDDNIIKTCSNSLCPANLPQKCGAEACPANLNKSNKPVICKSGSCIVTESDIIKAQKKAAKKSSKEKAPKKPSKEKPPKKKSKERSFQNASSETSPQSSSNEETPPMASPKKMPKKASKEKKVQKSALSKPASKISYENFIPKPEVKTVKIKDESCQGGCKTSLSDVRVIRRDGSGRPDRKDAYDLDTVSLRSVEKMCNTVGQLAKQIDQLMVKIKTKSRTELGCKPNSCKFNCAPPPLAPLCPRPCHCRDKPQPIKECIDNIKEKLLKKK